MIEISDGTARILESALEEAIGLQTFLASSYSIPGIAEAEQPNPSVAMARATANIYSKVLDQLRRRMNVKRRKPREGNRPLGAGNASAGRL